MYCRKAYHLRDGLQGDEKLGIRRNAGRPRGRTERLANRGCQALLKGIFAVTFGAVNDFPGLIDDEDSWKRIHSKEAIEPVGEDNRGLWFYFLKVSRH